jgi:hypothetical protein
MLFHHIPQEHIVEALEEIGIKITQSNLSNWKTHGGYREWCLAQDYAIQLHQHQDNLVDSLRRHDASELSEVGLQAAATQLSRFFLTAHAAQLLASNPEEYDRRVSMLSRISAQLKGLQKYRDDCAKELGYKHNPERIRHETKEELEKLRYDWSRTIGNSAKDPDIPHRNELPKFGELYHLAAPEPPSLVSEFKELLKAQVQRPLTAKAQLTDDTAAKSTDPQL